MHLFDFLIYIKNVCKLNFWQVNKVDRIKKEENIDYTK